MVALWTLGHGRLDEDGLLAQLATADVRRLVDVRRFPGSRTNHAVSRDVLPHWLPDAGVEYVWAPDLGGRRTLPKDEPVVDTWWRVAAFQAYAAYTRTPEFAAALDVLLAQADEVPTAIMCSESVWWRCHRRVIADVAVLGRDAQVTHLMPGGRTTAHAPSSGARRLPDGSLVWDGAPE